MSSPHDWQFYLTPQAAWDAMYEDCSKAQRSIEMEQYIFQNEELGRQFLHLFIEKARQGVKVLLILDAFGSASFVGSPLVTELRTAGGHCYFYNMIRRWDILRPWRWFPRTHIKSLLVDSTIAYTGGVCFAEYMRDWRDTHIRVSGPVAAQFRSNFDRAERTISRQRNARMLPLRLGQEEFTYLQSAPLRSWFVIYLSLIHAIRDAEDSMDITTPFFAPNRRFRRLLRRAAQRGVKVRLLVPRVSDTVFADWLFLSYARKLLKAGVKIYRYQPCILHNKTVVIDDRWATVGSTNMDVLSFFRNRESNLFTRNKDVIAALRQHFEDDLKQSRELTLDDLAREPAWKFALGHIGRLFKTFVWRT